MSRHACLLCSMLLLLCLLFSLPLSASAEPVDNGFTAEAVGETWLRVPYGNTTVLSVTASCTQGVIHYQWMERGDGAAYVTIGGATGSSVTTAPVIENTEYCCHVTDDLGHAARISFFVNVDTQLTAGSVGGVNWVRVVPGETAELAVTASCLHGDIHYQWLEQGNDYDYEPIADATGASVTTGPVTARSYYICRVSDDYDQQVDVYFTVEPDNQTQVFANGPTTVDVAAGDTALLSVTASCVKGSLSYQWYVETLGADGRWSDLEMVPGAVSNSLRTGPINMYSDFMCRVTDEYGETDSAYFTVRVDNGLVAVQKQRALTVAPGGSVTMEVEATCNDGPLSYNWDDQNCDEPCLTVSGISEKSWYSCSVRDIYGNGVSCQFEVSVESGLWIEAVGETERFVSPGEDVSLAVRFGADEGTQLDCRWSVYNGYGYYGDWVVSSDKTGFTLTDVNGAVNVSAQLYDQYGNWRTVDFSIGVDNDFNVSPVGDTMRTVQAGDSVTLAVQASALEGGFSYAWYRDQDYMEEQETLDGQPATSVTFTAEYSAVYRCIVRDQYGTEITVYFTVKVSEAQAISVGQSVRVSVQAPKRYTVYAFTPPAAGAYTFYSFGTTEADPFVRLYDAGGHLVAESDDVYSYSYDSNDVHCRMTARLAAGQMYQYWVSSYKAGAFSARLIREASGTGEGMEAQITLRAGQTVTLPALFGTIGSVTSGDTATVSVSGTSITALRAGTASVTAAGATGTAAYEVMVVSGDVLTAPVSLRVIEENAFAGDSRVRFVTLGGNVSRVGPFAFSGTGLEQIVIPSANTELAVSAFNGVRPLIVCRPGSRAEAYAQEYGYTYVYIQ